MTGTETSRYRTDVDRATDQTRWMLCSMPWLLLASLLWPVLTRVPADMAWWIAAFTAAQGVGATTAVAYGVGRATRPKALLAGMAVMTAVQLALLPYAYEDGRLDSIRTLVIASIVIAIPSAFALSARPHRAVFGSAALAESAATALVVFFLDRPAAPAVLVFTATAWTVIGVLMHSSLWFLAVLWQLNAAREVQARLVVAEERLRFARDLHDVIGRNLAVIALKSELAERLAENPKARAELADVQNLTRGLHKEIRDVVKGYRSTDLGTEMQGARSVLEAAGITCHIRQDTDLVLGQEAQTALGWAVREGVTNVLRHSHATHCTIGLSRTADGTTRLTITNDGAGPHAPAAVGGGQQADRAHRVDGSGLAGLAERLAPFGGNLHHGASGRSTYRLLVHLPNEAPA
ncbi:sensor histidine kinase [Streptomyces sp. NPDC059176]|uniref:sensor histidine kinase n=1 Tax=Streptomyces sp. NPDC059176 TaxID=3346758 RepID=UPI0036A86607